MRKFLEIPVSYPLWIISRLIIIAAALIVIYSGLTLTPYSWTNLMLVVMGVYTLTSCTK